MGKKKAVSYFPVARIKKMMQADDDVGKIATATPILVGKALECMIEDVLTSAARVAISRRAKTVQPAHMREAVDATDAFDFLRARLAHIPKIESAPPGPRTPRVPRTPKAVANAAAGGEDAGPAKRPRSPRAKQQVPGGLKKRKSEDGPSPIPIPVPVASLPPPLMVGRGLGPAQGAAAGMPAASSGGSGEDGDDDEDYDEDDDDDDDVDMSHADEPKVQVPPPQRTQVAAPLAQCSASSLPSISPMTSQSQPPLHRQGASQPVVPAGGQRDGIVAASSQPSSQSPRGDDPAGVAPSVPAALPAIAFQTPQLQGPPSSFIAPAGEHTPLFTVPDIPMEPMRASEGEAVPEKSKAASPKGERSDCTSSDRVSVMSLLS